MMKYTIGWESNGKKAPILWEKYEYQFPRLSQYYGFCFIFPYRGKFIEKLIHFPYAEVYHRIGIRCEKTTHTMGEVWVSVSRLSPYHGFCCNVPWEIYGETHSFPIWWYRLIFSYDILYLRNFFNYNAWNRYSSRGAFRTLSNIYDWVFLRK